MPQVTTTVIARYGEKVELVLVPGVDEKDWCANCFVVTEGVHTRIECPQLKDGRTMCVHCSSPYSIWIENTPEAKAAYLVERATK